MFSFKQDLNAIHCKAQGTLQKRAHNEIKHSTLGRKDLKWCLIDKDLSKEPFLSTQGLQETEPVMFTRDIGWYRIGSNRATEELFTVQCVVSRPYPGERPW